jgi:hypothetical protein
MKLARPVCFIGSVCLLALTSGCGASATSTAKSAPAPAQAPEAAAPGPELQPDAGISSASDEAAADQDREEAAEEGVGEEPSSLVEIADEDETISLNSLADADALLTRSVELIDELLGKRQKRERSAGAPARLSAGTSGCGDACKAFASLERAADAVCRLAGEDTHRCRKAREIVAKNERRVAVCSCADE